MKKVHHNYKEKVWKQLNNESLAGAGNAAGKVAVGGHGQAKGSPAKHSKKNSSYVAQNARAEASKSGMIVDDFGNRNAGAVRRDGDGGAGNANGDGSGANEEAEQRRGSNQGDEEGEEEASAAERTPQRQQARDHQPKVQNSYMKIYQQQDRARGRAKKMQQLQDAQQAAVAKGRQKGTAKPTESARVRQLESTPTAPEDLRKLLERDTLPYTAEPRKEGSMTLDVNGSRSNTAASRSGKRAPREVPSQGKSLGVEKLKRQTGQGQSQKRMDDEASHESQHKKYSIHDLKEVGQDLDLEQKESNYGRIGGAYPLLRYQKNAKAQPHSGKLPQYAEMGMSQNSDITKTKKIKNGSDGLVRSIHKQRHNMNKSQNANLAQQMMEKEAIYNVSLNKTQKRKSSVVNRKQYAQMYEEDSDDRDLMLMDGHGKNQRQQITSNGHSLGHKGVNAVSHANLKSQSGASLAPGIFEKNLDGRAMDGGVTTGQSKGPEQNSQRQISLPQLKQAYKQQADPAFMNTRARPNTFQQPYVDDTGSLTAGSGSTRLRESKPGHVDANLQYKSYDSLQRMNSKQQKNQVKNYGDITIVKKTNILALNTDKNHSYINNQHGLKDRYSNSPYANGPLSKVIKQVSMVNKSKFNSLNAPSDQSLQREAAMQQSIGQVNIEVAQPSLGGIGLRGQLKPVHAYQRVQSSSVQQGPYKLKQRADKEVGDPKRGGATALSKASSTNAYSFDSLVDPKQNRKEHGSALAISNAKEPANERKLEAAAAKEQRLRGETDLAARTGKDAAALNGAVPKEYLQQLQDAHRSRGRDESVTNDAALVDAGAFATFAEQYEEKATSFAAASQASPSSPVGKKQNELQQEANLKSLFDNRRGPDPSQKYHGSPSRVNPHLRPPRQEAMTIVQHSPLQSKSSFRVASEPGSAQLSGGASGMLPTTMPPIVVPKSQVTMAAAKELRRQPMTDQKVRGHDAGRVAHRDLIRVHPINSMKPELMKIQQQIKMTQKEQRMLERDLSQLRKQKIANNESSPDLNLHQYQHNKPYDSSKDVYKQNQYIQKPKKSASKVSSKKHSIVDQRMMKQANSMASIVNKAAAASEERVALKPTSSMTYLQAAAEADGKRRDGSRTPGSTNGAHDVAQDGHLDTIQNEDPPSDDADQRSPAHKNEAPAQRSGAATPTHHAGQSRKSLNSLERNTGPSKSKAAPKTKTMAKNHVEDERPPAESRKAGLQPGHQYQTISPSSRNKSTSNKKVGVKSLESSLGSQQLLALNQQDKSNPTNKSGTSREPIQSKRNVYADQHTVRKSNKKTGHPDRANQRLAPQGESKLANIPKKDAQPSPTKNKFPNRREAANEGRLRLQSPLKARGAAQALERQEATTKRGQGNDDQTPVGRGLPVAPAHKQQPHAGALPPALKPGSQAVPARQKRFDLEQFEVLKLLGQGSFGKVKLVRHAQTGQLFAMKCLSKEAIRGRKQIQHIQNEKAILAKFQAKDFCCNIHESLQDETNLYMILDYLPGGELFKQIKSQMYLSEADTRFYLAEVVLAIDQLHSMNIIYRDLKPENILIDRDGHLKLIDFGFSKCLKNIQMDRAFTNCGTPGYCAPEVMLDAGYSYKADIWSIGIMICEMLGGFTPFQNKNEASNPRVIMEKCRSGSLNLPKNLKGVARDLVKSLLAEDPHSRLEISQIKEHKFFRNIDWGLIRQRKVAPPFVPEQMNYFDQDALLDDSFNMRNQKRDQSSRGDQELVNGLILNSQKQNMSHRSSSNIDDVRSVHLAGEGGESGGASRAAEKPSLQGLATGGSLPFIDAGQSPGLKQANATLRKLSQIPESHLDTANHMDSNSHRHHHLAVSSSLHQNTTTPTPNNQTQSTNIHQPFSREKSDYSSKKYSATGGTGGLSSTVHRKIKMPTKVLGDYQLQLVNKAFLNF